MKQPLVSIIVPCYNVENYVKSTFDSISNQSYDNIEIIFVDDGSTDQTNKLLRAFCKNNKSCKLITQKNNGVSSARNKGIKISKGDFIFFCDSDDLLHKDIIKTLVNGLISTNSDIACCKFKRFKSGNIKSSSFKHFEKIEVNSFDDFVTYSMKKWQYNMMPWAKLYKKSIIKRLKNNLFDEEMVIVEDLPFILQYANKSSKFCFINKKLYFYRIRKGSSTIRDNSPSTLKLLDKRVQSIIKLDKLDKQYPQLINAIKMINLLFCDCAFHLISQELSIHYNEQKIKYLYGLFEKNYKLCLNSKIIPCYKNIELKRKNRMLKRKIKRIK